METSMECRDADIFRNAAPSEYRRLSDMLGECRTLADMQRFAAACHASPCADAEGCVYLYSPDGDMVDAIGPHETPSPCEPSYSIDGRTVTVILPDGTRAMHTAAAGWRAA